MVRKFALEAVQKLLVPILGPFLHCCSLIFPKVFYSFTNSHDLPPIELCWHDSRVCLEAIICNIVAWNNLWRDMLLIKGSMDCLGVSFAVNYSGQISS
jgi:hypothetical protein